MTKFAQVGDYCPNGTCPDYGKGQGKKQRNIIEFGQTKAGCQRYRCNTCRATFTETKGTIFYRRRTDEDEISDTLAHVAAGDRISSLARIKGHKEDTIIDWLRAAGNHAEEIEAVLMAGHQIKRGQLEGLWTYVGNKGGKRTIPKPRKGDSSGGRP